MDAILKIEGVTKSYTGHVALDAGHGLAAAEPVATLYASDASKLSQAEARFLSSLSFADEAPKMQPLIYKTIL